MRQKKVSLRMDKQKTGKIAWFIYNPVAANLLMVLILCAGIFSAMSLSMQAFPPFPPKNITITVAYESSSPEIVENGVTKKVEEALIGLRGVEKITSSTTRSDATVVVQKKQGYSLDKLMREVKRRVDAISSLPNLAEKPVISQEEEDEHVLYISLFGSADHSALQRLADTVRQKLLQQSNISKVNYIGRKDREVTVEVDEGTLQAYGITLQELVSRIGNESVSDSGGELRTGLSTITLRADRQAYAENEFKNIVILTSEDGAKITLGEVATVRSTFAEGLVLTRFQGKPAITLQIMDAGSTDVTKVLKEATGVIERLKESGVVPGNIEIKPWYDQSQYIQQRVSLLFGNALTGIALIVGVLALFLNLRLAIWVAMGIPVAIAGTLALMGESFLHYTINELTTFGFIVVLGILVDDAIVIGENIYTTRKQYGDTTEATIRGASEVAAPATFGLLTTVAAFMPLAFIKGDFGLIFGQFAIVVVVALCFSLVESKFVLPAHLNKVTVAEAGKTNVLLRPLEAAQGFVTRGLEQFKERIYAPLLQQMLKVPGTVLLCFAGVLVLTFALLFSGRVRTTFFPNIPGTVLSASVTMNQEAGEAVTLSNALRTEAELMRLNQQWKKEYGLSSLPVSDIQTDIGSATDFTVTGKIASVAGLNLTADSMIKQWKKAVGRLEAAETSNFNSAGWDMADISIDISHSDSNVLRQVAATLKDELRNYSGVINVRDDNKPNQAQIRLALKPEARNLGVSLNDLSTQLRGGFQGYEVQRFQQGRDEVKVKVRYPADQRRYLDDLKRTRIRTADGTLVPLSVVVDLSFGYDAVEIHRRDSRRVITVLADTDKAVTSPGLVMEELQISLLSRLKQQDPDLDFLFSGEVQDKAEASSSLWGAFIMTMLMIYGLLAIPLNSYTKPFYIMTAIPFGFIGAVGGHWLLGLPLSLLSFFGILALCGVVVNDSLLLVSEFGEQRKKGFGVGDALIQSGIKRMRSILLTSITTSLGLVPLLSESSEQAQYLKPAAVSMAYGILFATVITLFLVPVLIQFTDDVKRKFFSIEARAVVTVANSR